MMKLSAKPSIIGLIPVTLIIIGVTNQILSKNAFHKTYKGKRDTMPNDSPLNIP